MGGPYLTARTADTLMITTGPRLKSWLTLIGCASLGVLAAVFTTDYQPLMCVYVFIGVAVGMIYFEGWEEFMLDRSRNKAKLGWSKWNDNTNNWEPNGHDRQMPLYNITAVLITPTGKLNVVLTTGELVPVSSQESTLKKLNVLADHIISFLHLDYIEDMRRYYFFYEDDLRNEVEELSDSSDTESTVSTYSSPRIRDAIKVLSEPTPPLN